MHTKKEVLEVLEGYIDHLNNNDCEKHYEDTKCAICNAQLHHTYQDGLYQAVAMLR